MEGKRLSTKVEGRKEGDYEGGRKERS